MEYVFVPEGFKAPLQVAGNGFIIRKLTVAEAEKDYKAVMSSKESLRHIFCAHDDWPADDMTLEENYNDLLEHQQEFDANIAFTYTVVTPDDSKCIGCLYIYPFSLGVYDARIFYWLVDDVTLVIKERFRDFINMWIPETFGFTNMVFPGRDMGFQEWEATVKKIREGGKLK